MKKSFGFLKTTALGGVIFLLPLVFLGILVGKVVQVVLLIAEVLGGVIPVKTVGGVSALIAAAVAILLLACFFAGVVARRALGKRFSQFVERNVTFFFPRYAIFKDQMAGSLHNEEDKPELRPVVVHLDDISRLAFEVERGGGEFVTVYLPGAPDPWSGSIVHVAPARVEPLDIEFSQMIAMFEKLGRDAATILDRRKS